LIYGWGAFRESQGLSISNSSTPVFSKQCFKEFDYNKLSTTSIPAPTS
jgi:hypothetical protein